ncbi:Glucosamine-6-phosphate isomerase (Glucosamine-6-phosphate deaminase) (GNPDA) (GlcN6P deaminase) [Tilletia horrida]|uniref:Beta-hexosaminidase n=1 Tax=Tilletia horrida TaxID=155126 RepID=A0AAN6JRE6_9BASI|nr:Glucosamine-6-phosphate isomerase (Glucosamine-6-phosphate deaminase) (GNPDA) (GlcN6P deaminase) [Tilletia horrida]KAK0549333.1 Glucosamine-6-phosphate isomerase (Glucosamine-6-phosphate deaminase) (GNPDA) (GlcN6P deaminase) [Tilletia horrida]
MQHFKLLAALVCALPSTLAIWPQPASLSRGNGTVIIKTESFHFLAPPSLSADLARAVQRTEAAIRRDKAYLLQVGHGSDRAHTIQNSPVLDTIQIQLVSGGSRHQARHPHMPRATGPSLRSEILQPVELHDESYEISLPSDGGAGTLTASSALGILRGLSTIEQLFNDLPPDSTGPAALYAREFATRAVNMTAARTRFIQGVPLQISDKPAFPWRGLILDTSRNFYSVPSIERTLNAMALVKLNTFHWHMVDAQSFPLQLPGNLSVLAQKGAYSPAMSYSSDDVKHVVGYAADRGINVNIEIDMPGHNYAGLVDVRPDLVECPNKPDWSNWANEPPSGQISLKSPGAIPYAQELIAAVSALFPSPYFSTGGDEVNLNCYGAKAASDIDAPLLKPFVQAAQDAVVKAGKVPMVWEEMAINFPETGKALRNGTIVETWTSSANVEAVLKSNPTVKIIHAPSDFFYLDCGAGAWLGNYPDGQSWCPFVTWQKGYQFDPYAGTQNVTEGRKRVLGGEVALWSEQSDETSLDGYLWPRAGSAAEGQC